MSYFKKTWLSLLTIVFGMTPISKVSSAQNAIIISKGFQVCARGTTEIAIERREGIDAVEGGITARGASVTFMVSRNPNLPASMNLKPDKLSLISRQLSDDLTLVAESANHKNSRIERLYAFRIRDMNTPIGPIQDQIFVQLWSDGSPQSNNLVRSIGEKLYRCR